MGIGPYGSLAEAELEYRIPVGDMVDMEEVEKDEVPGNPYRVQEDVEVENTVLDDAVEADVITEPKFESVVDDELETEVETFAETAVTGLKTVGKTAVTNAESVVKTDIPPNVLAYGNPCKVIKKIIQK